MNRILITDTDNPLGQGLAALLERHRLILFTPKQAEINWLDENAVAAYISKISPDVVINTHGWNYNARVEDSGSLVKALNNIVTPLLSSDVVIIQFSSSLVFDGASKPAVHEQSALGPVCVSGKVFEALERCVQQHSKHLIIRLGWVIGSGDDNLIERVLSHLLQKNTTAFCADCQGAPTLLDDVLRVSLALVQQLLAGASNWGAYHYCSADPCSEVEFAEEVANTLLRLNVLHELAHINTLEQGERPHAYLSCGRIREDFGVQQRSWRQGLTQLVRQCLTHRGIVEAASASKSDA